VGEWFGPSSSKRIIVSLPKHGRPPSQIVCDDVYVVIFYFKADISFSQKLVISTFYEPFDLKI